MGFPRELLAFPKLKVNDLMTLAVFSEDENKVRSCFIRLRELRERLRQEESDGLFWDVLSMGMSVEFECAIEEGATEVRDGYAIFSPCSQPDVYCWPV